MRLRLFIPLILGSFAVASRELAARQGGGYGGYGGTNGGGGGSDDSGHGGSDDNAASAQSSATGTASADSASSSAIQGAVGATSGDQVCQTLMCVTVTKNTTHVEYVLASTQSSTSTGWMGIGFGTAMAGTEMVIMWANSDGSVTISQRKATTEAEPKVISNPSRIATLDPSLSITSGNPAFAFTLPVDGTSTQNVIFALGNDHPTSKAADAQLFQHQDHYASSLNLNKVLASNGAPISSGAGTLPPLTNQQKMIVAHAVLSVLGFMLFLPAGIMLARYWRTFSPMWFKGHWIAQFGLAGPIILIGIILGVAAVSQAGAKHASDTHMQTGLAILVLYFTQCSLGAIIHFIKPKSSTRRPPQNYLHAILGLAIIALALFQINTGFDHEWPTVTGRGKLPSSVKVIWIIWVIALPALYAIGLSMLPRQFRQEAEYRARQTHKYSISRPKANQPMIINNSSEYHRMDQFGDHQ